MKALLGKIPAVIAMLLSLFSFYWFVMSFTDLVHDETGLLSAIMAMFSVPFFFIDAIISFVKAVKKNDAKFNYILTLVLAASVPMVLIFAGDGKIYFNVIWNIYYLLMFVLEAISIRRICAAVKADRQKAKENAEA